MREGSSPFLGTIMIMELITRDIINPYIEFIDIRHDKAVHITYAQLCNGIDIIKDKILNQFKCKEGDTVLIGIGPSALQIATFFACSELGLQVIILDHGRDDNWIATDYVDPKTQSLMPIKYFIVNSRYDYMPSPKQNFFKKVCEHFVVLDFNTFGLKIKPNETPILAKPDSIVLKCTSSGTTGTAKIVKHNHQFLFNLLHRNKIFYKGNICMVMNLNHGSSPATYFLPALVSENTNRFISCMVSVNDDKNHPVDRLMDRKFTFYHLSKTIKEFDIQHLMIPYTFMIEQFLQQDDYPNLSLYTLSTIQQKWLEKYNNKKIKDIISFFGCNETSGPLLINKISYNDFTESGYRLMDDFYSLDVSDKNLTVNMPIYLNKISTNDVFDLVDGIYYHKGRNDLYRVNGHNVDLGRYNKFVNELLDGLLVVDTVKDKLYLAIWTDDKAHIDKVKQISKRLEQISLRAHKVDKYAILEQQKFYSGVKLDMELIRDYFRKFVM